MSRFVLRRRLKKKYRIPLLIIFILLCLTGMVYSIYNIIEWKKDIEKNNKIKEEINEKITIEDGRYNIDFNALKQQNNDTVAYLKVPGTNIEYVVVRGGDNSYYLSHNFNREDNIAGWIFSDYRNRFDGTDRNIVIFGHNSKDGSMFETLINVLKTDWHENKDNLVVDLITEKGQYKYQVFSTYSIEPENYYINTIFNNDNDYKEFLDEIKSRSNYDYGVDLSISDKVLTLSSCIGDGSKRVVLHAKLAASKEYS